MKKNYSALAIGIWPLDKIGSEFIPFLDEGDLMLVYLNQEYHKMLAHAKNEGTAPSLQELSRAVLHGATQTITYDDTRFVIAPPAITSFKGAQRCRKHHSWPRNDALSPTPPLSAPGNRLGRDC